MFGGIVLLLEILIIVMDYRGSKSLLAKQGGVKEQRVDGSSNSRNLDFVRCTLVLEETRVLINNFI